MRRNSAKISQGVGMIAKITEDLQKETDARLKERNRVENEGTTRKNLERLVLILSAGNPTRHSLDALKDGTHSHVSIEIHFKDASFPCAIHEGLSANGFKHVTDPRNAFTGEWQAHRYVRRWEAKRATDENGNRL